MMTKREINFFSETLSSGNFTEFLNLFIPGLYDKGTIVTDVLDPNLRKIDTWAKTVDEQFNKICGQNIEGFIEDVGTKKENNFYLSKNKNGLYLCNGETSSTDPDDTVAFTKMDINTIYELITSLQTSNDKKLDKGTVPASLNSAEKIVAALQGNGGLKFDENLLYLNDEGTKKVGYYYLDRLADGIFECLEQTEETVNNSAKFRDISNKASADRLDNLSGDIGPFRKIELGVLMNGAESDDLPVGQYIVIGTHSGGFLEQNLIGVFTIVSYYSVDRDKWIDVEPISSYMSDASSDNTYRLQFNPCRRRVRNTTANAKNYYAYHLGV